MSKIKLFHLYKNTVRNKPYMVQSVQTVGLMAAGDLIAQCITEKKSQEHINCMRTLRFGCIGFILGPLLTKWYRVIDTIVNGSLKTAILKKVALDQLVFAPCVIAGLTTVVCVLEGHTSKEINEKLKNEYFCILFNNYKVWPLVQIINFSFVPLDYRVLVTQSVAVAWNTYLSWKLNSTNSTS